MKKLIFLFSSLMLFTCSKEVLFNSPAFQGNKDGVFWRANSSGYTIEASTNTLVITGQTNAEKVELHVPSGITGSYTLSENSTAYATFTSASGIIFTTQSTNGTGLIDVENLDATNGTYSGSFRFFAESAFGDIINYNEGVFFEIASSTGNTGTNSAACTQAIQAALDASLAFINLDTTDPNYTQLCNEYKTALQNQITACGDPNNVLQQTIDSLGDCMG